MDDNKQIESLTDQKTLPGTPRTPSSLVGLEKARHRGGYVVGTVGWSGLLVWLISRFVFFLVSAGLTVGGIAIAAALDESVRIGLRAVVGVLGQETPAEAQAGRLFPILQGESRNELTVRWKQLLSEVQLEQSTYPPRFVAFVRELTFADVRRIDQIAPYFVEGAILRSDDESSGHDVPGLVWEDFARLQTIGVLAQGQFGQRIESASQEGRSAPLMLRGKTLALLVSAGESSERLEVPVTAFTEEGKQIIDLLHRPTSFGGMCRGAARLAKDGLGVRILAKFDFDDDASINAQFPGDVTSLCQGV